MVEFQDLLISAAPGVGAALLSVYNFYKSRQGPVIKISPIYQVGVINLEEDETAYKLLILSIPFENFGTAVGSINSVKLELTWDNQRSVLYPIRRVELTKSEEEYIHQEDFVDLLPILPVYVPAFSGASHTFEFHDLKTPFPIEKDIQAILHISYKNHKKVVKHEFIIHITNQTWRSSSSFNDAVSYSYSAPPNDPEFHADRLYGNVKSAR